MKISNVRVSNFRNIDGITVKLHPEHSYIIGENNLGKSNFLSLLNTVCNGKSFDDNDYSEPEKTIEVELELKLRLSEQGFFGDNFCPKDASSIKIRYSKAINEAYPSIISIDSNESIQIKHLRKINFLKYETTSIPSKELRLDNQKGAGLLLNNFIDSFIKSSEDVPVFLNDNHINKLTEFINGNLKKIRSFRDYAIKATVAPNPTEMLTSLYYLSDGVRKIDTTGSGVKYMAMASISILCQIMELYRSKSSPFKEHLFKDSDGKMLLPIVLSIDEPEVHLHPFLQRSLIGYYKRILQNKDAEFVELLKMCFGIDGIDGQLIIVTHSTDALVGDYRNLIRFYKKEDKAGVVSGTDTALGLTSANEKHLIRKFPEIKEAFYSNCAILIEGATEYGCIKRFAEKLQISLDDYGICVINVGGEKSIPQIRELLAKFKIPSIAIYDRDVIADQSLNEYDFCTIEPCFEIEIVKTLYSNGQTSLIREIVKDLKRNAENVELDAKFVKKGFDKMGIDMTGYIPKKLSDVRDDNESEFCQMFSAWFITKKDILLGRIIGDKLPIEFIPECYSDAIKKAKKVSCNA